MVTTKINIKSHLAEYLNGKFPYKNETSDEESVRFPDKVDLYHTIWNLLEKRPVNCPVDKGNCSIALPSRREGKDPRYYNYLGERSVKIIERKAETFFFAELHDLLDENKHRHGITYLDTVHEFMRMYNIESITPDALLKDYYRWREVVRKKKYRRRYKKI